MSDIANWDHERIASTLETCTGQKWLDVAKVIRDNEVHGRDLAAHISEDDPSLLMNYFADELGEPITKFVSRRFSSKLLQAASTVHAGPGNQETRSPAANPASTPVAATCVLHVDFVAPAAASGTARSCRLMLEVPTDATAALVRRRLLDDLQLPLFSSMKLIARGNELSDAEPVEWAAYSFVHAILRPGGIELTPETLRSHACIADQVVLHTPDGLQSLDTGNIQRSGISLAVDETVKPLGNGAVGVTYLGTVSDTAGKHRTTVAVKRFFLLETPRMYGMATAADITQWANRELYPEINTLLSLSHPRLVRLRCVGLRNLMGADFPAFIAMDYCNKGTLENWVKSGRMNDIHQLPFLQDFIDAMSYLHVEMKIIHRDIKPDNVFVHQDPADSRPYVVVGDVRHTESDANCELTAFTISVICLDYLAGGTSQEDYRNTRSSFCRRCYSVYGSRSFHWWRAMLAGNRCVRKLWMVPTQL